MQFGRYTLTRRVAAGGMAEVWKAKASGAAGFEKTVAIKKVLPNLASDPEFTRMFIGEAKLVAGLQHANVVQVFDFGQVGEDQYYLAMEYVPGSSLVTLCRRLREKKKLLPLDVALYVVIEAARGLGYAHTRTDAKGNPLGIIHRDVSPHNLLVSFEGEVKVADFGIARAESRVSLTATGNVRGKASYMSPEQARGEPLDARSDLFSLGLVLYELVTGQKLFSGDSTGEVMGRVASWHPGVMDEVPEPVRPVLRRALAAKPESRYPDAAALEEALAALLPPDAAVRARKAFAAILREELAPEKRAEEAAPADTVGIAAVEPRPPDPSRTKKLPDPPRRRTAFLAGAAAVAAAAAWVLWPRTPPGPPPTPGEAWFAAVRSSCNLLEVEARVRALPPPAGTEGAGYAAACYVLAGKSERAREVITALPEADRPAAVERVYEIAAAAAGADDESTVRVMELVLAFAPDHPEALFRAGMAEHRLGSDAAASEHLTLFLALHPGPDDASDEARAALARVAAFAKVRDQLRARSTVTPKPLVVGTSMVALPAGCFDAGDDHGEPDEAPRRRACVDAFLLDRHEVTNRRYREFLAADGGRAPPANCCNPAYDYWAGRDVPEAFLDRPVINVSWKDATAFCAWEGKRLPSEAEWEYAARGGLPAARFPWGDEPPVDDPVAPHGARFAAVWSSGGALSTVGRYAPNAYGLFDMAGNVWEWTADRYRADWYALRPEAGAPGPGEGECCVVRGGSWASSDGTHLRVANRLVIGDARPSEALRSVGFRCAATPP